MKRLFVLLSLLPCISVANTATIKIDVGHVIDQVDPRIYGIFMEPIGRHRDGKETNTLYGPVYDPKSPLANEHGFRKDIIEAARELQLTQMRWPGGNFTSSYDWRDGIGPKDQRPKRVELAWGVIEPNQVGTDKWVQLRQNGQLYLADLHPQPRSEDRRDVQVTHVLRLQAVLDPLPWCRARYLR